MVWSFPPFVRACKIQLSKNSSKNPQTRKTKKIAGHLGMRMHDPGRDSGSGGIQGGVEQIGA